MLLFFSIGIAFFYALTRIIDSINAEDPPDYQLKTYSYKKIFGRSIVGLFIVCAVSIGIYGFSKSFELAISLGAFFLCIVLAYLVWCLYWQRFEKRRGARLEE